MLEFGFRDVHLEGDSFNDERIKVEKINMSYTSINVLDTGCYLNSCHSWKVSFVHNESNIVTHHLAKYVRKVNDFLYTPFSLSFWYILVSLTL